jgi:hypothetical protein
MVFFKSKLIQESDARMTDLSHRSTNSRRVVVNDNRKHRVTASSNSNPPPSSGDDELPPPASSLQRCFSNTTLCMRPSKLIIDRISVILSSKTWQILTIFFTTLLLFGMQLQQLWIPKKADIICDFLYIIALIFFVLDIILRSYTEQQYFEVNCYGKSTLGALGNFQLGSFMFWCDILSSTTLLYNISFINKMVFSIEQIQIELDSFGFPVSCKEHVE